MFLVDKWRSLVVGALGMSFVGLSTAQADDLSPVVETPNCAVMLNAELKMNTVEGQMMVADFFVKLQQVIESGDEDGFLDLVNMSGEVETGKAELLEFLPGFFESDYAAYQSFYGEPPVVTECLDMRLEEELKAEGVSFTSEGVQLFSYDSGHFRTNHPAFYHVSLYITEEVEEDGDSWRLSHSLWAGPHDGRLMFTLTGPYAPVAD